MYSPSNALCVEVLCSFQGNEIYGPSLDSVTDTSIKIAAAANSVFIPAYRVTSAGLEQGVLHHEGKNIFHYLDNGRKLLAQLIVNTIDVHDRLS